MNRRLAGSQPRSTRHEYERRQGGGSPRPRAELLAFTGTQVPRSLRGSPKPSNNLDDKRVSPDLVCERGQQRRMKDNVLAEGGRDSRKIAVR